MLPTVEGGKGWVVDFKTRNPHNLIIPFLVCEKWHSLNTFHLLWKRLSVSSVTLSQWHWVPVFSVDKFLFLFSFVWLPHITVFDVGDLNANSSPKGSYVWTLSHQRVVLFEKAGEILSSRWHPTGGSGGRKGRALRLYSRIWLPVHFLLPKYRFNVTSQPSAPTPYLLTAVFSLLWWAVSCWTCKLE